MLRDKDGKPLYNGMIDGFTKIVKEDGIVGLYRGVGLNLIKVVPFAALQFTLKDEVKKLFVRYNASKAQAAHPQKKK